jgi:uncharacterized protein (UPF0335 family)
MRQETLLTPEEEAALRALMEEVWRLADERDQVANESARIWAEAYQQGGEEAAKNALRERLLDLQRRSRAKQMEEQAKTEARDDEDNQ